MGLSRRQFVASAASCGIALSLSRAAFAAMPDFETRETLPGRGSFNPAATPGGGRIDGPAKVAGAKLYASDFRASDLPGWPSRTSHALLIRATDATHVFAGLDLSRLQGALAPSRVVTATDLANAGIRVPEFYEGDLFCPVGKTPRYLGQPLAMLIFEQFDHFRSGSARLARAELCQIRRGDRSRSPLRLTARIASCASPEQPRRRRISSRRCRTVGWCRAAFATSTSRSGRRPTGKGRLTRRHPSTESRSEPSLQPSDPDLLVLDREFDTQSVDPVFLEPEAGIAWYDASGRRLEVVLGTQSPMEVTESLAYLLGEARPEFKPAKIHAPFRLSGRRLRRPRSHDHAALYRARRDVLSRPSGAARATTATSSFSRASSEQSSRCTRASASIAPPAGSAPLWPITCPRWRWARQLLGAGRATSRRRPRSASTTFPRSTSPRVAIHSRGVTAGSMRGYGTLADDDRARSADRRSRRGVASRPDRVPQHATPCRPGGKTMTGNPLIGRYERAKSSTSSPSIRSGTSGRPRKSARSKASWSAPGWRA